MNPQILQTIKEEVARQIQASRDFNVVFHEHTGIDSPQILISNVIPFSSEVDVYNNAVQSIPNNTETVIHFNTEVYDRAQEYDPVTFSFTTKQKGTYFLNSMITLAGAGTINVQLNGVDIATSASQSITQILKLNKGDVIKITAKQVTGGAINSSAGRQFNFLTIRRII